MVVKFNNDTPEQRRYAAFDTDEYLNRMLNRIHLTTIINDGLPAH